MIVVAGEALVDLVPAGGGTLAPRLGGGPYNAALAAARLGAPTGFVSRLSTDSFGDALLGRLAASGVDTALAQRGVEPTSLAVVALEDGHARYTFYTEGTADRLVADPGPLPDEVTVFATGTLGMVLEPGASTYEAMLRREHGRGVLTVLDPNIRSGLIADAGAYRARFAGWLPHVRLLKLSVPDAAWLADGDAHAEVLRSWLAAGAGAVVLTDGAAGMTVYTPSVDGLHVPAVPAEAVDTIGAGDTVLGALLAWLHGQAVSDPAALTPEEWRHALGFAATAAAITVSRSGAEPPAAADVEKYHAP
ncbi:MAG: carbohydrate kinase [Actinophytocola sp.]|nr:carbohydrate kinase [Actinophytocola sp.]